MEKIENAEKALKRKIFLSVVPEKKKGEVQKREGSLEKLIDWLKKPVVINNVKTIKDMKEAKSTKGGFLFVSFEGNRRITPAAQMADAIMIDLDDVNWSVVEMFKKYLEDNNIFAIFYSTASNTAKVGEDNGSWRIIIFLEEPVMANAYKHLYLNFLEKVGLFKDLDSYDKMNKSLNGVDFSMLSVVQMAFRPTAMKAEDYIFEIWNKEGNFLSYTDEDIFNGEVIESIIM